MKSYFYGAAAAALGVLSLPAFAQQAGPVWQPHVDVEAKPGSKRNIGEADFFLPIWQDGKGLFFGNARLRVADHDNREGNLGLGYRRMLEGGWNIGGYGYFDRRRSTTGNYFNQVTLGAEALGRDWDFRGNVYLPQGDKVRDLGGAPTITAFVSANTVFVSSTTMQERALQGYDLEAGWRVPVWAAEADKQLRLYGGGYHFSDNGVRISGPRVRAELTMAELPALWKGAQLTLGAEYQDDNARGGQGFVSARIRIPLGSDKDSGYKMNWQERRMAAPVVRDVDVVTRSVASAPVVEAATSLANGQALVGISSDATTGAALPAAVTAAGANSTVVLGGTFNTAAPVVLQAGQTLMGAGTLTVRTASGQTVTVTTPGATIASTNATNDVGVVAMVNNSALTGMTLMRAPTATLVLYGVDARSRTGVSITGNTIILDGAGAINQGEAIRVGNTTNAVVSGNTVHVTAVNNAVGIGSAGAGNITVTGNTITAAGGFGSYGLFQNGGPGGTFTGNTFMSVGNGASAGPSVAAYFANTTTATVSGNILSATGGGGVTPNRAFEAGNTTFTTGSVGNVNNGGNCVNLGGNTGAVGFANTTPCP